MGSWAWPGKWDKKQQQQTKYIRQRLHLSRFLALSVWMQSIWEAFSANYRSCIEKRTLNATSPPLYINPSNRYGSPIPIEGGPRLSVGRRPLTALAHLVV
ncbi:hypothetical protein CDAR_378201 [Caerostris darwini]|uniref:Uncharacterized protein n=1 Tax=Caerostris darwini TaxID=1538125 RepID=A0AAV4PGE9_9ARAC|nr:hypothetical protein CDAR_378201 [Caerostris darwini]